MNKVLLLSLVTLGFVVAGCVRAGETASSPVATPSATPSSTPAKGPVLKGTVDGGGGKGVVCVAADGTETVKTLDLFESEVLRDDGIDPEISATTTIDGIALIATHKMTTLLNAPMSRLPTEAELKTLVVQFLKTEFDDRLRPQRKKLPSTADATVPSLPNNCHIVQIAIWEPKGEIALDLDLWDKLEIRDQAALKIHEYVYAIARKDGATNSDETRWLTGAAFSAKKFEPRFPESMFQPHAKVIWCYGGGGSAPYDGPTFEIYAQEESEGGLAGTAFYLQYTHALKAPIYNSFTRNRSFVPAHTLAQLLANGWPASIHFRNDLKNYTWIFETTATPLILKIQDPAGQIGLSYSRCKVQ